MCDLDLELITVMGKGFERRVITVPMGGTIEDLPASEIRARVVATMGESGLKSFPGKLDFFKPGGSTFVESAFSEIYTSSMPFARVIYAICFAKAVDTDIVVDDVWHVLDPGYPWTRSLIPGPSSKNSAV